MNPGVALRSAASLMVLSLSACGGSSSGSSGPPVSVTLDSTSVSYTALALGARSITVTPDPNAFTFVNLSSQSAVVKVGAPATGGIEEVSYTPSDATHGGLTFTFAAPSDVGVGQHVTMVEAQVCLDTGCANQVALHAEGDLHRERFGDGERCERLYHDPPPRTTDTDAGRERSADGAVSRHRPERGNARGDRRGSRSGLRHGQLLRAAVR